MHEKRIFSVINPTFSAFMGVKISNQCVKHQFFTLSRFFSA